jgi:hypothetical protein
LANDRWLCSGTSKECAQQDAEKGRQLRSRLIEILNVPLRVRLQFRFVCGLADDLFEHLAWFALIISDV